MSSVCLSVCQSVCLSVTLVDCDHIGWNTSEIISPLVSLGCSLSADPNIMGLLQGEHPKFGPKVTHPCWFERRKHSIWLQIAQWSQRTAYRKLPSLFLMVPSLTPYDLNFPQNGGSICSQDTRMVISLQRVIRFHFMFGSRVGFSWSADRMALFPTGRHLG